MKLNLRYVFSGILALFFLSVMVGNVLGQTETPTPSPTPTLTPTPEDEEEEKVEVDLGEIQSKIAEYESKINELQGEVKSLSSQLQIVDSQIALTQLRIEEAEKKIENLQEDIEVTENRIYNLEGDIDGISRALLNRIVASYKYGNVEAWEVLLTSGNIDKFFTRLKYLKIVQHYDQKNILAAEQSKVSYSNQQDILVSKQEEAEQLYAQLDSYNEQLASERVAKEDLLNVTKNSEREYQARLADAVRELTQIQQAAKILISSEPRDVNRGEPIGLMGNTGYSFGAHLHFGLYNISSLSQYNYYSNHENPANALSSSSVNWTTGCSSDPSGMSSTGSGGFQWPMSTSNLRITQGYGHTCYSDIYYKGNPHPAYDMVSTGNIVVSAADKGKAYFCRNCTGDGANGVFIFHENGKMTLYWHLQ